MFNQSDDDYYLNRNHKHLNEMNIKIVIHIIFYITIVIIIYESLYISYLLLYLINIIPFNGSIITHYERLIKELFHNIFEDLLRRLEKRDCRLYSRNYNYFMW
jgi:hypothetical protein